MRLTAFCMIAVVAAGVARSAGLTFDAVSVKLVGYEAQQAWISAGGPGTNDPGLFRVPHMHMWDLLGRAFGVDLDQITGPAWLRDLGLANYYSIVATMPPDTTQGQFQLMLQNMLVERFHLVFHHESRNFPGYELVVDKGGPKFREVIPSDPESPDYKQAIMSTALGADGFPNVPGRRTMGQRGRGGQQRTKYQEGTMAEFVSSLGGLIESSQGRYVNRGFPQARVVDKTGLTGKYTFILEYDNSGTVSVRSTLPEAQGSNGASAAIEPDSGFPNLFVAIQKQLGLRLIKTADIPLDMIVVDSVDKVPTEN